MGYSHYTLEIWETYLRIHAYHSLASIQSTLPNFALTSSNRHLDLSYSKIYSVSP